MISLRSRSGLCPDDETMAAILMLLNLWQDANPDHMVAMVPAKVGYEYEIIRKRRANGCCSENG